MEGYRVTRGVFGMRGESDSDWIACIGVRASGNGARKEGSVG